MRIGITAFLSDRSMRPDQFAREALIDMAAYEDFVAAERFDARSVRAFGARQCLAPGIVVGRLRHDGYVGRSALGYLRHSIDWG